MGFGPKAPDIESGVKAVQDLIELLYPERAKRPTLTLFGQCARALLTAKAPLTFENIERLLTDPEWRSWIQNRWPDPVTGPWDGTESAVINPADLDENFNWLLKDRINANRS